MRIKELLESFVGPLLHLGLGSPFGLVETLVSGAGPLTARQAQVLSAAVETLGRVKEEIVLSDLLREPQECLQLTKSGPGLFDELVPVNNVDLFQGKISHPPGNISLITEGGRETEQMSDLTRW